MSDLYDQVVDADMDAWLAEVAKNADNIMLMQDRLGKSPEFVALMNAYRVAPREKANEYLQTVADYVILFQTEKANNFCKKL